MKKIKYICLLTLFLTSALFLCSCNKEDGNSAAEYSIPDDVEVVKIEADRALWYNLSGVEEHSEVIIKGKVTENLGQDVETNYNMELKKDLPGPGWTDWNVEVTEVYKGDVEVGDSITYGQDYYLWDNGEFGIQLITITTQKPVEIGEEYLLFLINDEINGRYFATGDHEGKYSIPSEEIINECLKALPVVREKNKFLSECYSKFSKNEEISLTESEIDKAMEYDETIKSLTASVDTEFSKVYEYNMGLTELYCEVIEKYFE